MAQTGNIRISLTGGKSTNLSRLIFGETYDTEQIDEPGLQDLITRSRRAYVRLMAEVASRDDGDELGEDLLALLEFAELVRAEGLHLPDACITGEEGRDVLAFDPSKCVIDERVNRLMSWLIRMVLMACDELDPAAQGGQACPTCGRTGSVHEDGCLIFNMRNVADRLQGMHNDYVYYVDDISTQFGNLQQAMQQFGASVQSSAQRAQDLLQASPNADAGQSSPGPSKRKEGFEHLLADLYEARRETKTSLHQYEAYKRIANLDNF